jgi:hypothetical protein
MIFNNVHFYTICSPLYGSASDKYPQYNTDFTIKLLVELGADKEKIIMGVPCKSCL